MLESLKLAKAFEKGIASAVGAEAACEAFSGLPFCLLLRAVYPRFPAVYRRVSSCEIARSQPRALTSIFWTFLTRT